MEVSLMDKGEPFIGKFGISQEMFDLMLKNKKLWLDQHVVSYNDTALTDPE